MPTNHNSGAEHAEHQHAAKAGSQNMMAILAYLWILIIIPFLTPAKDEPFVKYHLKQGLALLIFEAIGWVLGWFLVFIPFLGWLIMWLWWLAALILTIVGVVNVLNGVEKELPLVGKFGKRFKF
jgi:uncharacterized membrane protein